MSKTPRPSIFLDTRALEELKALLLDDLRHLARIGELVIETTDPILTVLHKAMRGPVTYKDLSDAKDRLEELQSWARSMAKRGGEIEGETMNKKEGEK